MSESGKQRSRGPLVAAAIVAAVALSGCVAQGAIDVRWHEDGLGFTLDDTVGLVFVTVRFCSGGAEQVWPDQEGSLDFHGEQAIRDIVIQTEDGRHVITAPLGCGPCAPEDLQVAAEAEGMRLSWSPANGTDHYTVYRALGDEDASLLTTVEGNATTYLDRDIEPGASYSYHLRAVSAGVEQPTCGTATGTAVPLFPNLIAAAAAACLAGLAYAVCRRH